MISTKKKEKKYHSSSQIYNKKRNSAHVRTRKWRQEIAKRRVEKLRKSQRSLALFFGGKGGGELHYGSEHYDIGTSSHSLSHELDILQVSEQVSELTIAAERASKENSAEQANEWAL